MTDDDGCVLCGSAAYHLDATGCCKWCRDHPGHAVGSPPARRRTAGTGGGA